MIFFRRAVAHGRALSTTMRQLLMAYYPMCMIATQTVSRSDEKADINGAFGLPLKIAIFGSIFGLFLKKRPNIDPKKRVLGHNL